MKELNNVGKTKGELLRDLGRGQFALISKRSNGNWCRLVEFDFFWVYLEGSIAFFSVSYYLPRKGSCFLPSRTPLALQVYL